MEVKINWNEVEFEEPNFELIVKNIVSSCDRPLELTRVCYWYSRYTESGRKSPRDACDSDGKQLRIEVEEYVKRNMDKIVSGIIEEMKSAGQTEARERAIEAKRLRENECGELIDWIEEIQEYEIDFY